MSTYRRGQRTPKQQNALNPTSTPHSSAPDSDLPSPSGVILSAGLGTRLRPLSFECPKPLVPVCGRPLLEWALEALREVGIKRVGVNTYHLAEQISGGLSHRTEQFIWSHERELQGTGGGARDLCRSLPQGEVIIINGDAFFDFTLQPLLNTHRMFTACSTLALRAVHPDDPFGRVGVDAEGRVVRIAEVRGPLSDTEVMVGAFTGVQVITPEVCDHIPEGPCDIFRTAHRVLLNQNKHIQAHFVPKESLWVDVGTPERYLEAHHQMLLRPQSPLWKRVPSHKRLGTSILFDGAEIIGDHHLLHRAWVGQGAVVHLRNTIDEFVIWPRARWSDQVRELKREGGSGSPVHQTDYHKGVLTPHGFWKVD